MLVLGIDPGLTRCGYGLISQDGSTQKAVSAGVIRTSPDLPVPQRLVDLRDSLRSLLEDFAPDVVAVERVLFQVNVSTAMGVGQACGIALVEAVSIGAEIAEYSPNQVKLAVAGHGGASKQEVADMVKVILKLDQPLKPPDVADAMAVALCHLSYSPRRQVEAAAGARSATTARAAKTAQPAPT